VKYSLAIIPAIHILMYLAIGLDLPIFRQIIVFIYLTFVPGFILLRFMKLKETKIVDMVCFSIGLSLAFLMFVGFFINQLFLVVGISQPLSTIPLEITLSVLTWSLFFVGYRRDIFEGLSSWRNNFIDSRDDLLRFAILISPVLFSIIGALYVSVSSISTPFLFFMIFIIAVLFAIGGLSHRLIPSKFYPLMVFTISIALVFHILLISKYVIGSDSQLEFQIFRLTLDRGYWTLLPNSITIGSALNYNAMLSVTVLPSIYSALLNIDGGLLFKFLYPFVFSLIPVGLYRIYEEQIGKSASLLSTLFFISSPLAFYGVVFLSTNRETIAVFFLVLSILILLDKTMSVGKRQLLFLVFGAALIVSHYSTAYLYLAIIFLIYIILQITGKNNKVLTAKTVLLLSAIGFAWYSFTESPLLTLGTFFYQVYSRFFQDLSSTTARSSVVFASHSILTFASVINWVLFITVHFMVLIGILVVILKSKKLKLDPTYRILMISSAVVLFIALVIPNVGPALDFSRFYQLSLLFLAPCFVLGGQALLDSFKNLLRRAAQRNFLGSTNKIGAVLVCVVLVGYFLSQSGFINSVTEAAPLSFSLDFSRFTTSRDLNYQTQIYSAYIPEQNYFSAVWLTKHAEPQSIVYADYPSRQTVLLSYGMFPEQYLAHLNIQSTPEKNNFIYLSKLNIGTGVIFNTEPTRGWFNTSEISSILKQSNLIYSNGNGEIWRIASPD